MNAATNRAATLAAYARTLVPSAYRATVENWLYRAEACDRVGATEEAAVWRLAARLAR